MPIPVLIGAALVGGVIGAGGHISAREKNERAQRISEEAQRMYNEAKGSFELAKSRAEESLMNLGYAKKDVFDTSFRQFIIARERIKRTMVRETDYMNETAMFQIDSNELMELRQMSNIYESTFSNSAKGAAAGAAVAFAASGSLPLVGMMMEGAGSYLVAGEIGAAAGMAGSALSIGASMSPMAFIAAPVVLFTGISASMKADENLEKAQVMHSEAESASEQMKNSEILCNAVAHKSDMFHQLLVELNSMFSKCAAMSNSVTYEISINKREFTRKEYELLAVTESLAKAVKTIIDTPILSADGNSVDENAEKVYENTALQLPVLQQRVQVIDSYDYNVKPVALKQKNKDDLSMVEAMRNVSAVVVATFVFILLLVLLDNGLLFGMVFFSITFLTIMNNKTEFSFFKKLKSVITVSLAIEFIILLFYSCDYFTNLKYFLITDIVAFVIQLVVLVLCFQDKNLTNSIKMTITRVSASLALFCIGLLLYDIFANAIGISSLVTIILIEVLYIPGAFIAAFIADYI